MEESNILLSIAEQLRKGDTPPPVTVRDLLSWFHAQRRGAWIVETIRESLREASLRTEPDFESAYLDSPIEFVPWIDSLSGTVDQNSIPPTTEVTVSTFMTAAVSVATIRADPTFRISKLAAANQELTTLAPDSSLREAVTKMMASDYSQLPVLVGEREVKGVVSWKSIGSRLALGIGGALARNLMDPPQEIRSDTSLFQAIPIIVDHQYVLVRGLDNCITGIVTASDLNLQFQQLAEPFLLLLEIENHIRRVIGEKFSALELSEARDPSDTARDAASVSDLTYGEYIRLVENRDRWTKLALNIDRATFCRQLDRVRLIRNEVMHFDPDGISEEDLHRLRDFVRFLQDLQHIGAT